MHVDITTADEAKLVAVRDAINDELAARRERDQAPAWVTEAVRSALDTGVSLADVQAAVAEGAAQSEDGTANTPQ